MKSIKLILHLIVIAFLTSCGNPTTTNKQVSSEQQTPVVKAEKSPKSMLTNFSNEDVARFAISSIMGQPSKTIKVKNENGLYVVSYIRKSDSKKFDYKIKIDKETIVWASFDGRWRDSEYDERISFEESDNKLKIIQTFSDGSVDIKEYNKGQ